MLTLIVEDYYNQSYIMGKVDFALTANKIVQLFPNESSQTYYVQPASSTKSLRGKLVDKYRYYRKKMRKLRDEGSIFPNFAAL
jgi:hypothetical protein